MFRSCSNLLVALLASVTLINTAAAEVPKRIIANVSFDNPLAIFAPTPERTFFSFNDDGTSINQSPLPSSVSEHPAAVPLVLLADGSIAFTEGNSLKVCDPENTSCVTSYENAGGSSARFRSFLFSLKSGSPPVIKRYDLRTGIATEFAYASNAVGVIGLAVGNDGLLYVTGFQSDNHSVVEVLDPITLTKLRQINPELDTEPLMIRGPIAVNAQGEIYLTDFFGTLYRFDAAGNLLGYKGLFYTPFMTFDRYGIDIAIDGEVLAWMDGGPFSEPLTISTLSRTLDPLSKFELPIDSIWQSRSVMAFGESKCAPAAASVAVDSISSNVAAGKAAAFKINVGNQDSVLCDESRFGTSVEILKGGSASLGQPEIALLPAADGSIDLTITTDAKSAPGNYPFSVMIKRGSDAAVSVSSSFRIVDTIAPTKPKSLKAKVAKGQVTLTWKAATDNQGVANYKIYRDSLAIGSVPGTMTKFVDQTTKKKDRYKYSVTALDSDGNESAQSNVVRVVGR